MTWNHSPISRLTNPENPESIKKSYGLILFLILFSFLGAFGYCFLFIIIILFFSLLLLLFHSTTEWKCAFIFLTRHTHTPVNQLATKVLANSLRGLRNEKKKKKEKQNKIVRRFCFLIVLIIFMFRHLYRRRRKQHEKYQVPQKMLSPSWSLAGLPN